LGKNQFWTVKTRKPTFPSRGFKMLGAKHKRILVRNG
jgi:hypothetical protein